MFMKVGMSFYRSSEIAEVKRVIWLQEEEGRRKKLPTLKRNFVPN